MTGRFLSLVVAFGLCVGVAPAWSQEASVERLTVADVGRLVPRAGAPEHVRLVQHFSALADWFAAESKRHETCACCQGMHTEHAACTHACPHCQKLVVLNAHLDLTARALSAYHQRSVLGRMLPVPSAPVGVEAHAPTAEDLGAFRVTIDQLDGHRAMAAAFTALAGRYDRQVEAHTALAGAYRAARLGTAAAHCDRLVTLARDAAREARAAAQMHARLGAGTD
jgi:hypothetical protein